MTSRLKLYHTLGRLEACIDEAGLGPLAGPAFCAVVIWNPFLENIWKNPSRKKYISNMLDRIKDSKKMTSVDRYNMVNFIKAYAIDYQIEQIGVSEIEKLNIRNANFLCMHRALSKLRVVPEHILIDGNAFTPYHHNNLQQIPHTTIIKGDDKYIGIAAASILAKTSRDKYILDLVDKNPVLARYGWEQNFGYSTAKHIDAIKKFGITEHHRQTFGVCKTFANNTQSSSDKKQKIKKINRKKRKEKKRGDTKL